VNRSGQQDPFEDDVAMPATAPTAVAQFDPFEEEEPAPAEQTLPAPEMPAADAPVSNEPAEVADVQEAFEEPQVDEQAPTAADELEAAQEAIDREMMRREVESGAAEEMVAPAAPPEEENALEAEPEMNEEIVPPVDEESYDSGLDMTDEELDLEMQYGAEGQPQAELTPEQLEARRQELERERIRHEEQCNALYNDVRNNTIKDISLDISLRGEAGLDYPLECTGRHPTFQPRSWAQTTYLWKASGMCHKPLYFEQVQLERYGHDWGPVLQPFVSGAHFFGTVAILPYKMGLETPQECIYTLGHYRPGSCAPYMITQPGFTWRAAAFQTGAVTGISAAVP
jgi:hypothetical protein